MLVPSEVTVWLHGWRSIGKKIDVSWRFNSGRGPIRFSSRQLRCGWRRGLGHLSRCQLRSGQFRCNWVSRGNIRDQRTLTNLLQLNQHSIDGRLQQLIISVQTLTVACPNQIQPTAKTVN
uniref:(northern house mosquito) hypothetical protein n=1 Tax=Culex pipiens TaxID=7175 RepID=A0A8D8K5M2_CULPI